MHARHIGERRRAGPPTGLSTGFCGHGAEFHTKCAFQADSIGIACAVMRVHRIWHGTRTRRIEIGADPDSPPRLVTLPAAWEDGAAAALAALAPGDGRDQPGRRGAGLGRRAWARPGKAGAAAAAAAPCRADRGGLVWPGGGRSGLSC